MKKTTGPTPKEIAKRRLAKNPIMKIPLHERNNITNKENVIPEITFKKSPFRKKDRNIEILGARNPFDIPQIERIFSKCKKPKKQKPDPIIMSDVHTIRDIDNHFFKEIEGRPLRRSDDVKVYMNNIRDICLFKANAAYLRDRIIQIDTAIAFENNEYDQIVDLVNECRTAFTQFIATTYQKSRKIQMIASVKTFALERKMEEFSIICDEFVELRNRLADISFKFDNLARYRHFLDKLTPVWWIIEKCGTSADFHVAAAQKSMLSRQVSIRSGGSIDINVSNIEFVGISKKDLYFVDPVQIINIFEDYRRQSLTYLNMTLWSSNTLSTVLNGKAFLQAKIEEETKEIQSFIDIYDSLIKFEEEKEICYQKAFEKILLNEFQQLFASFDVSKLFTCIQYVNTKLFGDMEDPRDNISSLTSNIENHYMGLLLTLEELDNTIVKIATKQAFDEDIVKMKRAYKAQRIIRECDILSKSLYTSFEPPRTSKKKNVTAKKISI